jgi:hypothetical protein
VLLVVDVDLTVILPILQILFMDIELHTFCCVYNMERREYILVPFISTKVGLCSAILYLVTNC